MVIFQPAFVPAQLFLHFFGRRIKCGIDIMGMAPGLCRQPGRKMYNGFTNKFTGTSGKNNLRIRRAFGVFFDHRSEFGFHVNLQRFANVNLLAADLVKHIALLRWEKTAFTWEK